jgi:hypothetical protein
MMEKVFKKLLGKVWIVYRGCVTAEQLYRDIFTDAQSYLRRVVSSECSLIDLESRKVQRSNSCPNLLWGDNTLKEQNTRSHANYKHSTNP